MEMKRSLSAVKRRDYLRRMSEGHLDLLVIGGGITGAGIALDASSRGLLTGLVEMQDFAEGTSSRSTKLIHGGLRYLKQLEFQLVREVGREREILFRNAPHLVIPEKMLLPIIKGGTYGTLATSFGLWLYDRLAGVRKAERRVMLNREETIEREPLLRRDILKGGGLYYEYRTDDARLVMEVLKSAAVHGALCANYTQAKSFLYENGRVIGVKIIDRIHGEEHVVRAKKIVNATGPWVDEVRKMDDSLEGKHLRPTKGVHIVVGRERFPIRQSVYFDVPDGRMVFAIPRGNATYIGTTDTDYKGDPARPEVTREDVDYLLRAANAMFPDVALQKEDIISGWAGLRPLIQEEGKSPSEVSRKDEMFFSSSGLITIAGGKLTGFRKMAQRVVDQVAEQLRREEGKAYGPCRTERIVLSGGEKKPERVLEDLKNENAHALPEAMLNNLVYRYGTNAKRVIRLLDGIMETHRAEEPICAVTMAELRYAREAEMVVKLEDFLVRRSGMLYFEKQTMDRLLPQLHAFFHQETGEMKDDALSMLEAAFAQAVSFK